MGRDTARAQSHPARPRLDEECRRLLAQLRERCPHLFPADPLTPGGLAPARPVTDKQLSALVTAAAREAAAGRAADSTSLPASVLWEDGSDALLVDLETVAVELGEGTVLVRVGVSCDQIAEPVMPVEVTFAVGSPERPTGLLAATPLVPAGPPVVIARWADALIAFAWQALLDAVGALAAGAGLDRDGTALIPSVLAARRGELSVTPQARHDMDRVRTGSVVRAGGPQ